MYKIFLLILLLLIALPVWADDDSIKIREVVISASKIEEPAEETTSSVVVIPRKTIEIKGAEFISDVLKDVPEINLIQNGGQGKLADVVLRGGAPSQVLVLIDGVKVKSTTTGSFDFSGITADDIERIEIVKGPQSTMYGSEAIAGVINIITKKGLDKIHTDLVFEGGSFGTHKSYGAVSGSSKKFDYRFSSEYFSTDGISIAEGNNAEERDGYQNASFSTKMNIKPADIFNLEISGRYYYDRSELDDFNSGQSFDALNYIQHGHHWVASVKGKLYLFDIWEQILTVSNTKDSLKTRDTDTAWNNFDIITGMETIDWQNNLYFSDNYTLTAGFENRLEKGENIGNFSKKISNDAVYFNNKFSLFKDQLHVDAGIRYDDHETFGDKYTYRLGAVYNIKLADLRVIANYGTGFRAPTFNELFWPADPVWGGGNPNLKSEDSDSWEAGLEKDFFNKTVVITATYFNQRYDDMISGWPPVNLGNAEVKGFEAGVSTKITDNLIVRSAYTYMDTDDGTGQHLTRRPRDKFNANSQYSFGRATIQAGYTFVGEVFDSATARNLASYPMINLSGNYKLTDNIKLFGKIDNLLDEDYESAGGYSSPGFSAFGGIKFEI